jgi:hypothetical protein
MCSEPRHAARVDTDPIVAPVNAGPPIPGFTGLRRTLERQRQDRSAFATLPRPPEAGQRANPATVEHVPGARKLAAANPASRLRDRR